MFNFDNISTELLKSEIIRTSQLYYSGIPEISDDEFDSMVEELRRRDPNDHLLTKTGWGYEVVSDDNGLVKVKHKYCEAGSIDRKPRRIQDIPDYFFNEDMYVRVSAKLDGISCVLYYSHGILDLALTRGDGNTGIDITDKLRNILDIQSVDLGIDFTGSIRGELVMSNEKWNDYKNHYEDAKSSRNVVAGVIRRNEITDDLNYIDFVMYKVTAIENINSFIYNDGLVNFEELFNRFINVPCELISLNKKDDLQNYLEKKYNEFRELYPCDGCVITDFHPTLNKDTYEVKYDEIAYKFNNDSVDSVVKYVGWNRSRTGRMVPLVHIESVNLSGATISKATGFNAKYILDNKIGKNSVIRIQRSGEVIPDIKEIIKSSFPDLPSVCPSCGEKLVWKGTDLYCQNKDCGAQNLVDLMHFTSVIAPIHGLGSNIKEKFFEDYKVTCIDDFFKTKFVLGNSATADKLRKMISVFIDGPVDPVNALVALNIPRLGWVSARKVVDANMFDILANYDGKHLDELRNVVGYATCESILKNVDKLRYLDYVKHLVLVKSSESREIEQIGMIAITGKTNIKRSELEKIALEHGYGSTGNLKHAKYLVTNNPSPTSSKGKAAKELGVEIITENDFLKMIGVV